MSYAVNGYEVVPLFSIEEIEQLRHAVSSHMDRLTGSLLKPIEETAPDAPFDERIERIADSDQSFARLLTIAIATDAQRSEAAATLIESEPLAAAARRVTGIPVGKRVFRFRANSAALSEHRQAWHSDVSQVRGACSDIVATAWIPLTDAGPETGGLEIAPGLRSAPLAHDTGAGKFTIDEETLKGASTVIPEVPAGHCLFMDRFTPHRAVLNASGRTRWSLVAWMAPATAA